MEKGAVLSRLARAPTMFCSTRNEGGVARLVPQLRILGVARKWESAGAALATCWAWFVSEAVRTMGLFRVALFHVSRFRCLATAVHTIAVLGSRCSNHIGTQLRCCLAGLVLLPIQAENAADTVLAPFLTDASLFRRATWKRTSSATMALQRTLPMSEEIGTVGKSSISTAGGPRSTA